MTTYPSFDTMAERHLNPSEAFPRGMTPKEMGEQRFFVNHMATGQPYLPCFSCNERIGWYDQFARWMGNSMAVFEKADTAVVDIYFHKTCLSKWFANLVEGWPEFEDAIKRLPE